MFSKINHITMWMFVVLPPPRWRQATLQVQVDYQDWGRVGKNDMLGEVAKIHLYANEGKIWAKCRAFVEKTGGERKRFDWDSPPPPNPWLHHSLQLAFHKLWNYLLDGVGSTAGSFHWEGGSRPRHRFAVGTPTLATSATY